LLTDDDGITHLNYFEHIVRGGNSVRRRPELATRVADLQRETDRNLAQFENKDLKKFAKWAWFKKHLEDARAELPKELYTDA